MHTYALLSLLDVVTSMIKVQVSSGVGTIFFFWLGGGGSPARASQPTYPQIDVSLRLSAALFRKTEK